MANKITVLLADDHTLVRRGFRRLLEDDPVISVVGEASDGDEAISLAASLKPQVVVMDCAMPGTSGLVATKEILQRAPETVVLMLSMHSEGTLVRQALEAARGQGIPAAETWSGAGHDAQHLTALAPALLLFVPLHGGESHTPQEGADMAEIVAAARVVTSVLRARLAGG